MGARVFPNLTEITEKGVISIDVISKLFNERIICMFDEFDSLSAQSMVTQIFALEMQNPNKPITILINSPGGSVTDCMTIIDAMRITRCKIITVVCGLAASAGSIMLACGAKGYRYAMPNAEVMIHQPSAGYRGQVTDIEIHANRLITIKHYLNELLAERCNKSVAEVAPLMERDTFFNAKEALKFGIIDKILDGSFDDKDSKIVSLFS